MVGSCFNLRFHYMNLFSHLSSGSQIPFSIKYDAKCLLKLIQKQCRAPSLQSREEKTVWWMEGNRAEEQWLWSHPVSLATVPTV